MDVNPYSDACGPARPTRPRDIDVKTFTIPVSGTVRLYGPEITVVRSREFQRLSGIRQLGTAHLVFRGATHTRFEHSLGTLHRAEQIVQAVNANPRAEFEISSAARRLARLAALLHDLTHIPFGHTLEDEFELLRRHDINEHRIRTLLLESAIGLCLEQWLGSEEYQELLAILRAKTDEQIVDLQCPFVADIVGNTVCADSLDYIVRDMYNCGLPGGLGERFLDYFTVTPATVGRPKDRQRMALILDKRGMPRPDVESEVVKLLSYRYELAERVYFHHAKNSASVMIGRAVVDAGLVAATGASEEADSSFLWLSDELLLRLLAVPAVAEPLGITLEQRPENACRLASELATAVLERRLYKIAYLGVLDDLTYRAEELYTLHGTPTSRRNLEDELAAAARLSPGQVLVHLPKTTMMTKLAEVRVLTHDDVVVTLDEWDRVHSGRFRALNSAHERLWRLIVFVNPAVSASEEALIRAAAEDRFGARSRYRAGARTSFYTDELFQQHAQERGWTLSDRAVVQAMAAHSLGATPDEMVVEMDQQIRMARLTEQ